MDSETIMDSDKENARFELNGVVVFNAIFQLKNKHVICRPRRSRIVEDCTLCLEYGILPAVSGRT